MNTRTQKNRYRERLQGLMVQLDRGRRHLTREALQSPGKESGLTQVMDIEDISAHRAEEEVNFQLVGVEEQAIKDIQDALDRLDEGTYGRCESCQGTIGRQRLEALPHTRYCIRCAREMEEVYQG